MPQNTALVWLRNDLRLSDNPALSAAFKHSEHVTALYINETDPGLRHPGGASRWWLHHSLQDLSHRLAEHGVQLIVSTGKACQSIHAAISETGADAVFWNRRYSAGEIGVDLVIENALKAKGVAVQSFAANVLVEPWAIKTKTGNPYSVYTPFWNALKALDIASPLRAPAARTSVQSHAVDADYKQPQWARKLQDHWQIGEAGAHSVLTSFLDDRLDDYAQGRDFPARASTSKLSPHLRFGEISPRQIWHAAQALAQREPGMTDAVNKFLSELAWRDFNYHQLYHRDDIATVPMQAKYADMPWRQAPDNLRAWQRGQTGMPLIDAGMRELWATGFMQNRIRMLTASLLSKNLLIDWRLGEQWFWDCLCDADIANNPGNWQWVAGSGLDAAPYFRIFNPVVQGERFDADGAYVRQWVPELSSLPDKWIQQPFAAPPEVLAKAGVTLGNTYPHPIVDLKLSREQALEAMRQS